MRGVYKLSMGVGFPVFALSMFWILQNLRWHKIVFQNEDLVIPTANRKPLPVLRLLASKTPAIFEVEKPALWWSLNTSSVDARSIEYCRPVSQVVQGSEGQVDSSFTLVNVHVVIRHGERTTIYKLHNVDNPPISCEFEKYRSESPEVSRYLEWVAKLQLGSRDGYPKGNVCKTAQLTPRGLLQQIYNGKYLGRLYGKLLLSNNRHDTVSNTTSNNNNKSVEEAIGVSNSHHHTLNEIYARTSDYTRTFQSALGFIYGLQSELPDNWVPFKLALASRATNLCSPELALESCSCPSIASGALGKYFSRNPKNHANLDQKLEAKRLLGDVLGISASSVPWLGLGLEVLMGYVCQGTPLPCIEETGECVTKELLHHLWTTSEKLTKAEFTGQREIVEKTLEIHPLLNEIAHRFLDITWNIPRPKFVLYSGHDLTLMPLLVALGVNNGKTPSYASRFAIELYTKTEQYFIRVLFNGNDLTSHLKFCDTLDNGLCPLDYFLTFVFTGFKQYKNATYEKLCHL